MSKATASIVLSSDSPSLWNSTLSPGWTEKEVEILRLSIMKLGMGKWRNILKKNLLPGKTPSQLILQSQRLIGQQSLAEYVGIHLDPLEVLKVNQKKEATKRKNGCIINTGKALTYNERQEKKRKNKERFGLSKEQIDAINLDDYTPKKREALILNNRTIITNGMLKTRLNELVNELIKRKENGDENKEEIVAIDVLLSQLQTNKSLSNSLDGVNNSDSSDSSTNNDSKNNLKSKSTTATTNSKKTRTTTTTTTTRITRKRKSNDSNKSFNLTSKIHSNKRRKR